MWADLAGASSVWSSPRWCTASARCRERPRCPLGTPSAPVTCGGHADVRDLIAIMWNAAFVHSSNSQQSEPLSNRAEEHLVEMRLKTALKLLQLSEKRTAEADARNSAACWWPSRYVWIKWQISGSSCLTSMVSSRRKQSLDCWGEIGAGLIHFPRYLNLNTPQKCCVSIYAASTSCFESDKNWTVVVWKADSPQPDTSPGCPGWWAGRGRGSSLRLRQISASRQWQATERSHRLSWF